MESKLEETNIAEKQQPESSPIQNDQVPEPLESSSKSPESSNPKIKELISLIEDMRQQNSSGQLNSELCMQIFIIIEELTPMLTEKLKVDMDKYLDKIRKALKKEKFESKDQDASKNKGLKGLFKSSKNGLCYEAIDGYITALLAKAKGHEGLWEEFQALQPAVLVEVDPKKSSKKDKSSKGKKSEELDKATIKETSTEELASTVSKTVPSDQQLTEELSFEEQNSLQSSEQSTELNQSTLEKHPSLSKEQSKEIQESVTKKPNTDEKLSKKDKKSIPDDQPSKPKKSFFKKQVSVDEQAAVKEALSFEAATLKIQELNKLVAEMFDQNLSGHINPELCNQIYALLEELMPFFNEKLSTDLDKSLSKVKKALKKDKAELEAAESQKAKTVFQTIFKSAKAGLFLEATMLYLQTLVAKSDELKGDLSDVLKPLAMILVNRQEKLDAANRVEQSLEKSDDKKSSKKKKDGKPEAAQADLKTQSSSEEQSAVINQLHSSSEQATSDSLVDATKQFLAEEQVGIDEKTQPNVNSSTEDQKPPIEQPTEDNRPLMNQQPSVKEQEQSKSEEELLSQFKEHDGSTPSDQIDNKSENQQESTTVNKPTEDNKLPDDDQTSSKDKTLVKRKTSFRDKLFKKKTPSLSKQVSIDEQESKDEELTEENEAAETNNATKKDNKKQKSVEKQISIEEQPYGAKDDESEETTKETLDEGSKKAEEKALRKAEEKALKIAEKEAKKAEKEAKRAEKAAKKGKEKHTSSTEEQQAADDSTDQSLKSKEQSSKQKKSLFKNQASVEEQSAIKEVLTYEEAIPKVQELIKHLTDMFEQNTSGQINPELCSQLYATLKELTPFFSEKLSVDLDKYLSKIKSALKKVAADLEVPDAAKKKSIFQAFFKITKSGLFLGATVLYIRTLVTKFNENPEELSDLLKPLVDLLSLEDKKTAEKEQAAKDDKEPTGEDDTEGKKQFKKTKDSKNIEGQPADQEDKALIQQSSIEEHPPLTDEEAMSKVQELIKLASQMFEQNKTGQIEPELCTQMFNILQQLTPYFTNKLDIDLDKYLSKMMKALKKDMFELDLPDSSKRKQVFTAIFKYTKSGVFFGTATVYFRKLIAKVNETPGELSEALKPLQELVSVDNVVAANKPKFSLKSTKEGESEENPDAEENLESPEAKETTKSSKVTKSSKKIKSKVQQEVLPGQLDVDEPIIPKKVTRNLKKASKMKEELADIERVESIKELKKAVKSQDAAKEALEAIQDPKSVLKKSKGLEIAKSSAVADAVKSSKSLKSSKLAEASAIAENITNSKNISKTINQVKDLKNNPEALKKIQKSAKEQSIAKSKELINNANLQNALKDPKSIKVPESITNLESSELKSKAISILNDFQSSDPYNKNGSKTVQQSKKNNGRQSPQKPDEEMINNVSNIAQASGVLGQLEESKAADDCQHDESTGPKAHRSAMNVGDGEAIEETERMEALDVENSKPDQDQDEELEPDELEDPEDYPSDTQEPSDEEDLEDEDENAENDQEIENDDNISDEEQMNEDTEAPKPPATSKFSQSDCLDDEDKKSAPIEPQAAEVLSRTKQRSSKPQPRPSKSQPGPSNPQQNQKTSQPSKQRQQTQAKSQTSKSQKDEKDEKDKKSEDTEGQKGPNQADGSEDNKATDNSEESGGVNRFGNTQNFNDEELNGEGNDEGSMGLGAHRSGLEPEEEEEDLESNDEDGQEEEELSGEEEEDEDEEDSEEDDSEYDSDETEDSDDDSDEELDSDMEGLLDDFDSDDDDDDEEGGGGHKVVSILLKIAKKALSVALDLDV